HQRFELGRGLQASGNGGDDVHIGSARTAGVIWSVGGWDSRSAVSARGDIGLIRGIKYPHGVHRQSGCAPVDRILVAPFYAVVCIGVGALKATLFAELPPIVSAARTGGSEAEIGATRYCISFWLPLGRTARAVSSSAWGPTAESLL